MVHQCVNPSHHNITTAWAVAIVYRTDNGVKKVARLLQIGDEHHRVSELASEGAMAYIVVVEHVHLGTVGQIFVEFVLLDQYAIV